MFVHLVGGKFKKRNFTVCSRWVKFYEKGSLGDLLSLSVVWNVEQLTGVIIGRLTNWIVILWVVVWSLLLWQAIIRTVLKWYAMIDVLHLIYFTNEIFFCWLQEINYNHEQHLSSHYIITVYDIWQIITVIFITIVDNLIAKDDYPPHIFRSLRPSQQQIQKTQWWWVHCNTRSDKKNPNALSGTIEIVQLNIIPGLIYNMYSCISQHKLEITKIDRKK